MQTAALKLMEVVKNRHNVQEADEKIGKKKCWEAVLELIKARILLQTDKIVIVVASSSVLYGG